MIFSDNFILNIYEVICGVEFFDNNYCLYFLLLIYIFQIYKLSQIYFLQQIDIAAEHIDYTNA